MQAKLVSGLFHWLHKHWMSIRQWYHLLQPARICLLVSLFVPALFWFVPQGRDSLRGIASECADGTWWHAFFMFMGMLMAGMASWGWARLLLHCDFPAYDEVRNIPLNDLNQVRLWLQRICGLLPPVGMGAGFLIVAESGTEMWVYFVLALLSLGVATLLWYVFEHRVERARTRFERTKLNASLGHLTKSLVSRLPAGPIQSHSSGGHNRRFKYGCLADVMSDTFAFVAIVVTWVVSAGIFVTFTYLPVKAGMLCGSPAVVLFAVMAWISAGNALVYVACRYRVPLITLVLAWAVVCSCFNDNHAVRTLPHPAGSSTNTAPGLVGALTNWYAEVSANYPPRDGSQKRPLYLVASAGGGIRAAYWTTIVLGKLEESARNKGTSFAAHTFVLSGVSGGSLGEVTFAALTVHRPAGETNCIASARKLLGNDFLAADLAKMAFADLFQRFWPVPYTGWDRARSLEDAWAQPWVDAFHTNVLNESIRELYADATKSGIILPHLLLNGTCVETGQRVITSDLTIRSRVKREEGQVNSNGSFLDVIPAANELSNAPIRLSTAAHQSARFTYFSPAGRFADGTHIVDGGYFENSGASTLMDALATVQWCIQTNHWTNVEPRIILINNDPIPLPASTTNRFKFFFTDMKRRFLSETLSPVRALLNTRAARGSYAEEQALDYNWQATNIYQFNLHERPENQPLGKCKTPVELPLGWTLSSRAMDEMDEQLTNQTLTVTNVIVIGNVVATLTNFVSGLPPLPAK